MALQLSELREDNDMVYSYKTVCVNFCYFFLCDGPHWDHYIMSYRLLIVVMMRLLTWSSPLSSH